MCPTEDGPVMKNEVSSELYCWYIQETQFNEQPRLARRTFGDYLNIVLEKNVTWLYNEAHHALRYEEWYASVGLTECFA